MDKQSLLMNDFTESSHDANSNVPSTCVDYKVDFAGPEVNSALEMALLREKRVICHYLDLPTIMPLMQSRQLETGDEFMQLLKRWETGARESTVGLLLEILPRKHPNWSHLLFQSIQEEEEHKGHVYLVEVLQKSLEKASKVNFCVYTTTCTHMQIIPWSAAI